MNARNGGFTLVEMLVALTLIGLLSAALFGGLRLGARVWDTGGERIAATSDAEAARTFLRQRLAEAQPLRMRDPDGNAVPVFDGESDGLRFAAPWPPHLGTGGAYVFEVFDRPTGDRPTGDRPAEGGGDEARELMLDWKLHRPDGPVEVADGRASPRRLSQTPGHVNLRYYGRRDGDARAQWHDRWTGERHLPQLIELRLAADPQGAWPPLRVAVADAAGEL